MVFSTKPNNCKQKEKTPKEFKIYKYYYYCYLVSCLDFIYTACCTETIACEQSIQKSRQTQVPLATCSYGKRCLMPVMAKRGGQEEDSQDSSKLNSQGLMLGLGLKGVDKRKILKIVQN